MLLEEIKAKNSLILKLMKVIEEDYHKIKGLKSKTKITINYKKNPMEVKHISVQLASIPM